MQNLCCGCSVFFHLIPEAARYYVLYVFYLFILLGVFCIVQPWFEHDSGGGIGGAIESARETRQSGDDEDDGRRRARGRRLAMRETAPLTTKGCEGPSVAVLRSVLVV